MLKKLAITTAIAAALIQAAAAATVTTTGAWINPNPASITNGLGTSTISWGDPPNASAPQSSYVFAGVTDSAALFDGTPFLIGTFSHLNFPVDGTLLTGVDLQLDVAFGGSQPGNAQFLFGFDHYETPWDLPVCPIVGGPGTSYVGGCPDVVTILTPTASQRLQIGNELFEFLITGFAQNNQFVNQLVTYERQETQTEVFGELRKVGEVPEPASMVLVGSALLGLGIYRRRAAGRRPGA